MEKPKKVHKVYNFPVVLGWLKIAEIREAIVDLSVRAHFREIPRSLYPHGPGIRALFRFKNSYGASIIRSHYTYGGDKGKFELGIFFFKGEDSGLAITNLNPDGDVFGHLESPDVVNLLLQIIKLEPCQDLENVFVTLPKIEKVAKSLSEAGGSDFVENFNSTFGMEEKSFPE
jgi:hypothetical protein